MNPPEGTHEDERTVLFKTISLDGIKPNTNPNTNPNPKLILILTLFSCFMLFFEHRPLIFSLAPPESVRLQDFEIRNNTTCVRP